MAYRYIKNIWLALRQQANAEIWDVEDSGAPTSGTSGTGVGFCGPGSTYTDTATGIKYLNTNTKASPTWSIIATGSFNAAAGIVASGTLASGATTATTTLVSGALTTDRVNASWAAAPQTMTPVVAVISPAGTLAISFATTVGTAGTIAYTVIRTQ